MTHDHNSVSIQSVSMQTYVDMRFTENKNAVDAALAAQEKATAAALAAVRDKGTGRKEVWGYVVGAIGIIVGIFSFIHKVI